MQYRINFLPYIYIYKISLMYIHIYLSFVRCTMHKGALSYHLGRANILYLKFPESTLIIKVNNVATKRKLWYLDLSSFTFFFFSGILDQVTTRRLSGHVCFFKIHVALFTNKRGRNKFPARYASRSSARDALSVIAMPRRRIESKRESARCVSLAPIYIYMHNVDAAVE